MGFFFWIRLWCNAIWRLRSSKVEFESRKLNRFFVVWFIFILKYLRFLVQRVKIFTLICPSLISVRPFLSYSQRKGKFKLSSALQAILLKLFTFRREQTRSEKYFYHGPVPKIPTSSHHSKSQTLVWTTVIHSFSTLAKGHQLSGNVPNGQFQQCTSTPYLSGVSC